MGTQYMVSQQISVSMLLVPVEVVANPVRILWISVGLPDLLDFWLKLRWNHIYWISWVMLVMV